MINHFNIRTVDDRIYRFFYEDIAEYSIDLKEKIAYFNFKDGSFIDFNTDNITYIEVIKKKE